MSSIFCDEKHANNILERMYIKWQDQEKCDVVLIAGKDGTKVAAHRLLLSSSSEYFSKMFASSMRETHSENITLPNIEGEILKLLVEFFYTGRLGIREDNVEKLLATAHYLLLEVIVSACSKFFADKLCPNNWFRVAAIANRHQCVELQEKVNAYISKNFMDIYSTVDFLNLNFEQLCEFLASDIICVTSEEIVFHSLMLWVESDQNKRDKYKNDLIKLVRMPHLAATFLTNKIQPICSSVVCRMLVSEAINWHLLPECRRIDVTKYQTKPRIPVNSEKLLFFIENGGHINIKCYLPHCKQWIKCIKNIELKNVTSFAAMDDKVYIAHCTSYIASLNLKTCSSNITVKECQFYHRVVLLVLKHSLYAVNRQHSHPCSLRRWNPITQTWNNCPSTPEEYNNATIAEFNEKLYVFDNDNHRCPYFYDPDLNAWKSTSKINDSIRKSPGIAAANGFLYVVGGNGKKTVERYEPRNNDYWRTMPSLLEFPNDQILCTTMNNKLIVSYNNHLEEYDDTKRTWSRLTDTNRNDKIIGLMSYSGEISPENFVID